MKYLKLLLVVFVVSGLAFSQQRALLGPGDAIPVEKGQSALQLAKKMANKGLGPEAVLVNCPPVVRQKVGKYQGTINTNFGFFYGDVAAMVYQAPFTGVIESVYFESFGAVSNPDSSANLRIMHANTRGFATAATHMGYWPDTTSGDTIPRTAYQDEATGPFACSSISGLCYPPVGTPE